MYALAYDFSYLATRPLQAWGHGKGFAPWAEGVNETDRRLLDASIKATDAINKLHEYLCFKSVAKSTAAPG